jgi:DNA-binding MarR family transcriptional regulator
MYMAKGIQAEIKQIKPFSSTEEEVFIAILRTSDKLQQQLVEFFKPYGLSPTQFNALRILRGAAEAGLPCSEIGERMINHDPDITRLLDRLEQRDFVQRRREQKDRRVRMARITPAGLEMLKKLDHPVEEFHRHGMAEVAQSSLKSLIRILEKVRHSHQKQE